MPKPGRGITAEERFARIVAALRSHPGVTPPSRATQSKKRFGSSGLRMNHKIFAMISSKGTFVVKLPRQRVDALITFGKGKRFDPGHGRLMKEWLTVETASDEEWLRLAKEAMQFAASKR